MKTIALSGLMVSAAAIAVGAFVIWPADRGGEPTQEKVATDDLAAVSNSASLEQIDAADKQVVYDLGDESILPLSIEGYKDWFLVNEEPYDANPGVMVDCRMPLPTKCEGAAKTFMTEAAHRIRATATLLLVYINEIGRDEMVTEHDPQFPVGSIIVKEKWFNPNSDAQPELMTVMRKRESGFNPECGDWEFATFEGDGLTQTSQGRHASCMKCHTRKPESDFVFRSYLFGRAMSHEVNNAAGDPDGVPINFSE